MCVFIRAFPTVCKGSVNKTDGERDLIADESRCEVKNSCCPERCGVESRCVQE